MRSSIKNMEKQKGFTLIEIAIVLVIIGLLVGGVLQGQELIENSRVKQAVKDMNGTAAAIFAYQDRYGRMPGDDGPSATLTARGSGWAAVDAGDADGLLEVATNEVFTGAGEAQEFWQHLRAAGFIAGNPADAGLLSLPTNAWGGFMGVTTAVMGGNLTGSKVCLSQVPGSAAISIDNELDDGLGATGRLRATLGSSGTNEDPSNTVLAALYSEDNEYTICYRI
ncbi:MAG: prepilin-type N-terminal cleavage/methylation domain-containing protein [Proteobacteria bacterium]|nr:prepilin-type N-terminal cleavage/methylation domain-containing protein [Pseudomonadota bacterium]